MKALVQFCGVQARVVRARNSNAITTHNDEQTYQFESRSVSRLLRAVDDLDSGLFRSTTRLTEILPVTAQAAGGDFSPRTRVSDVSPPLGTDTFCGICDVNYPGRMALPGDFEQGTATLPNSQPRKGQQTLWPTPGRAEKLCETLQTSAKGVELVRNSAKRLDPRRQSGARWAERKSTQASLAECEGHGIGSAVASALGTAKRAGSSRQKAAPDNQGWNTPSGRAVNATG